jgi:integrase
VYIRGNTWYAQWRIDGITHKESTGIKATEKNAKAKAEDWLADKTEPLRLRKKADGIAILMRQLQTVEERIASDIEAARHKVTLGELEDLFRNSPRRPDCSAAMLDFYCGVLRRFASAVGENMRVEDFSEAQAEEYARTISKSMASGTYNKALNALTLVWRVTAREAGVSDAENPWQGLARRRSDAHIRRPFTREETDAILAAAEGELKTLIAVCLYTGLRLGDACLLKWSDIRENAIFVITAKRDRKVAIPLHPTLKEALGSFHSTGFVMPEIARRYSCGKQGPSNVSRSVKRRIERAGITTSVKKGSDRARPDATAHSLRHTFVTRAIEGGVPPHVVQAIVGHASATMTERYTHLSDVAVLTAFKAMS